MKEIIIYGAVKKGIKYTRILCDYGIEISGFCDTYKTGNINLEYGGQKEKLIFDLKDVDCNKYTIIIAIADSKQYEEIEKSEKI